MEISQYTADGTVKEGRRKELKKERNNDIIMKNNNNPVFWAKFVYMYQFYSSYYHTHHESVITSFYLAEILELFLLGFLSVSCISGVKIIFSVGNLELCVCRLVYNFL